MHKYVKKYGVLMLLMLIMLSGCASGNYNRAMDDYEKGDFLKAKEAFEELDGYKDSAMWIRLCNYEIAKSYMTEKKYSQALEIFETLDGVEDTADYILECKYENAKYLAEEKEYEQAEALFVELGDYRDCSEQLRMIKLYMLYDYIAENGKATDGEEEFIEICQEKKSGNEQNVLYLSIKPGEREFIYIRSERKISATGAVRKTELSIDVPMNGKSAQWKATEGVGINVSILGKVITAETAEGTFEMDKVTMNSTFKMDEFERVTERANGTRERSTDPEDSITLESGIKDRWQYIIRELPGFLRDIGIEMEMADFGFSKIK